MKVRGLARKEERSHNQPAKGDVILGQVQWAYLIMTVSDLDIFRSANLHLDQHGDQAVAKAREMVLTMKRRGDHDGADAWLRIIVAIETMRRGPDGAVS